MGKLLGHKVKPVNISFSTVQPPYTATDAVRSTNPDHGGIAIIFQADFVWLKMSLPATPAFECLGVRLTVRGSYLAVVAVYRPGSAQPSAAFFDDLTTLLESVNLLGGPFIVGGDFNIHVEDPINPDAISLAELFDAFDLAQRVEGPAGWYTRPRRAPTRHRWRSDCRSSSRHCLGAQPGCLQSPNSAHLSDSITTYCLHALSV